jgi:formylglycine-generating enzyme required for sulfatase activity
MTTADKPFVGLRSFEVGEAQWFFGRDKETSALVSKLQSAAFTAVVGPSGSGKSSLVRAGVVPLLRKKGWQEIITKPGSEPIARLARALALASPERSLVDARRFRFDTDLRASAFGLVKIVQMLGRDTPRLLLVIDQFEELFRYGDEAIGTRKAGMREESRAFVELLLTGANGSNGRLHVCVTMRSDFFGACSSYAGLAEAVSASQFLVPMPVRSQLEQIIRTPVQRANARIDDGLVQRLLVDVEEEVDKLPLLQHTLRRLWEHASGDPRRMLEGDYITIGKIDGSIDLKAEALRDALGKANAADLTVLERIMKALTDLDVRGRATRRMLKRSELQALLQGAVFKDPSATSASLDRVLKMLASEETGFLQVTEGKDPEIDVGHEALIRSWTRLSGPRRDFEEGWLREERADGARWRSYVTRTEEGEFISRPEEQNLANWLSRRSLGEEWARRYGDRWDEVNSFRAKSLRHETARKVAGVTMFAVFAVLVGIAWVKQDLISWEIKKIFVIRPFMERDVRRYVLKAEEEQALEPFSRFHECADYSECPEMVVIPPGNFIMGSDSGPSNERPPHPVAIKKRFAVSKYELTQEQWATCVEKGWCPRDSARGSNSGKYPVINISWDDAQQYVDWLSQMTGKEYRLLSEAEWEYVARAGTKTPYYWGDGEDVEAGEANCAQCKNPQDDRGTMPVGQFPPNQFGLYDTRGNAWELTADKAHPTYERAPGDGSVWSAPDPDPDWDDIRVGRGGGWSSNLSNLRASYRFFVRPSDRLPSLGLRVARTLDIAGPTK